jgi:hypothetical protein
VPKNTQVQATLQAAEEVLIFVILSEAKNLSSIYVLAQEQREILRFAQDDSVLNFFAAALAAALFPHRKMLI